MTIFRTYWGPGLAVIAFAASMFSLWLSSQLKDYETKDHVSDVYVTKVVFELRLGQVERDLDKINGNVEKTNDLLITLLMQGG